MDKILKHIKKETKKNLLIVVSGPTCSGKDTVMQALLKKDANRKRLVTTNSRKKRKGEKEGVDYYFVSKKEFEKLIADEAFFEWVEYRGDYRGTQKKHVMHAMDSGKDVIWRIDVRGVKNVYEKVKAEVPHSVFIFLAESLEVLQKRMEKRATENSKWRKWSIDRAAWELKQFRSFDYVVVNEQNQLDETLQKVEAIIEAKKMQVDHE